MTKDAVGFARELWSRIDRTPEGSEDWKWACGKDGDQFAYSKELAAERGVDLPALIGSRHFCCDCEVAFNLGEWDE